MLEIDQDTPVAKEQIVGDRYRLITIIGEGGMGTIWEAMDTVTNELRALKLIRRDRVTDVRSEARLLREARALSTISHENVARIYEVSELANGTPFLVMERLVGETLKQRVARLGGRPLPLGDTLAIARSIANGVRAAHAAGIVHRDLKPENVFLLENKTDEFGLKVLDFGIAKEVVRSASSRSDENGGAGGDESLTTTGAMLGTLHYMAPEQVFGDTDVDERADVWALGVVIYECLSGKKPTDATGSGQVLKAIMTRQFTRLDEVAAAAGCPKEIADLVDAMLSRDRSKRPSMDDVYAHLSGVPTTRSETMEPPATGEAVLATDPPTTTASGVTHSTHRRDASSSSSSSSSRTSVIVGAVIAIVGITIGVAFGFGRSSTTTTTAPPTTPAPIAIPVTSEPSPSLTTTTLVAVPAAPSESAKPAPSSRPVPVYVRPAAASSVVKPQPSAATAATAPSPPSAKPPSSAPPPFSTSRL